jgi:hypothetical protein
MRHVMQQEHRVTGSEAQALRGALSVGGQVQPAFAV